MQVPLLVCKHARACMCVPVQTCARMLTSKRACMCVWGGLGLGCVHACMHVRVCAYMCVMHQAPSIAAVRSRQRCTAKTSQAQPCLALIPDRAHARSTHSCCNIYNIISGGGAHTAPLVRTGIAPHTLIHHVLTTCQPVFINSVPCVQGAPPCTCTPAASHCSPTARHVCKVRSRAAATCLESWELPLLRVPCAATVRLACSTWTAARAVGLTWLVGMLLTDGNALD